jgi:L-amino acid N-acyltransferase YncA
MEVRTDGLRIPIRAATQNDIVAIAAIYGHHVETGTASFELSAPDVEEMSRRHLDITSRGLPYLVAERSAADGTVVGYAYVTPYRPRAAYRYTLEDSVYVDAGSAGRGVGKALLAAVIEGSQALGYRQMIAIIGGSDNHASIGLHAALGFEKAGRLAAVGRKFGRWIDSVLMQRSLGDGASAEAD